MDSKIKTLIMDALNKDEKQIDLARKIGISQSTIQKILYTNTSPTVATINKIANYFNVPVGSLLPKITGEINATLPPLQAQMTGQLILPPDPYIIQIYNLMQGKSDEEKEAMVRAAKETSQTYPQKKQKSA